MRLPSVLRTTPFRLTLIFLALFAAAAAAFLAYVYIATAGEVTQRADTDVSREIASLQTVYTQGGTAALNGALIERSSGERPFLYLSMDKTGKPITGNIAMSPLDKPDASHGATSFRVTETDPDGAMRANRDGPARLSALCARAGIPLIHISTDYVFDGDKGAPYVETDPTNPTGVYGATKLAGEHAVRDACPRSIVLRTAWVYSATGKNFVRTMLTLARTRDRLRVVADQQGCPTAAAGLAEVALSVARAARQAWRDEFAGVFHSCGDGATTWHGLAEAAIEEAARYGAPRPVVDAITTADYPTPAKRPADSRLDCTRLERVFGLRQPPWRDSLAGVVAQLQLRAEPAA